MGFLLPATGQPIKKITMSKQSQTAEKKQASRKENVERAEVGRAMLGNTASIRVLEKCQMNYIGTQIVEEHPAETYEAISPFIPINDPSK